MKKTNKFWKLFKKGNKPQKRKGRDLYVLSA